MKFIKNFSFLLIVLFCFYYSNSDAQFVNKFNEVKQKIDNNVLNLKTVLSEINNYNDVKIGDIKLQLDENRNLKTYASEFLWGGLWGLAAGGGAALFTGMVSSVLYAHHQGERDLINIDPGILIGSVFVISYTSGSIYGVLKEGNELDGKGSEIWTGIYGILGAAADILWITQSKTESTGRIVALSSFVLYPPLFSTFGYNLHRRNFGHSNNSSSFLKFKNSVYSIGFPKIYFTNNPVMKKISANVNLINIVF